MTAVLVVRCSFPVPRPEWPELYRLVKVNVGGFILFLRTSRHKSRFGYDDSSPIHRHSLPCGQQN